MRFIVALLIASLFVDKADSELSFIPRPNLYPCASYSPGVRSQKYSHPCPLTSIPRASYPFSFNYVIKEILLYPFFFVSTIQPRIYRKHSFFAAAAAPLFFPSKCFHFLSPGGLPLLPPSVCLIP